MGTTAAEAPNVNDLLREGIAAAKAGQREHARDLLMRVVERDEENVTAWLWLSGAVDSLEDREVCLENVLALDPDNDAAHRGLDWVRGRKEALVSPSSAPVGESPIMKLIGRPASPAGAILQEDFARHRLAPEPEPEPASSTSVPESPVAARAGRPASLAGAMLQEDFARYRPPPEPEPKPPPVPVRDEFDDEHLCPYCAAQTEPEDAKCKACGGDLWVRFRRQEKRSVLLWTLIAFQFSTTIQLAVAPLLLMFYIVLEVGLKDSLAQVDASDPLTLLNVYLGLSNTLSPEMVSSILATVPRFVFLLSFLPCLFSGAVLVALYLRWRPVYYLLLADAVLGVIIAFAGMALNRYIVFGIIGLALALLRLMLVFRIEDDFQWDKRRILLRVDRGLSSGVDFLVRGDSYAKRHMWAKAAIHLRRAAGWLPHDLDSRLALAVAYIKLKKYERATRTLAEARQISAGNPRVEELGALLDELRRSAA